VPARGRWLPRLGLCLVFAGAVGCTSLRIEPAAAPTAAGIGGDWQFDPAVSDDFDAKVAQLVKERQDRMRARRRAAALDGGGDGGGRRGGGSGSEYGSPNVLELPQEDSDHFRDRLLEDLRPSKIVHIERAAAATGLVAVDITSDAEPERRYFPGQMVSRIDASGAAQISCGWEGESFLIQAHYVHSASRNWRYDIEPTSHLLRVSFTVSDPEIGRMNLVSRYRRR